MTDSSIGLLSSLLSPEELQRFNEKRQKKRKTTSTGVVQRMHTPYKVYKTQWVFNYAVLQVNQQQCLCGCVNLITNPHILYVYERKVQFANGYHTPDETLDVHKTFMPRADVSLPDDIDLVKEISDTVENVPFCDACTDTNTVVDKKTLLSMILLDKTLKDVEIPATLQKQLVQLQEDAIPQMLSDAEVDLIMSFEDDVPEESLDEDAYL